MAEKTIIDGKNSFGWWVTGLVDGEGCFYASLSFRMKKSPDSGRSHLCTDFSVGLQIWMRDDDAIVVEKIRNYFGSGRINKKPVTKSRRSKVKGAKPSVCYRIDLVEDLIDVVIPHFETFPLQSKKANDFEIWRQIVEFVARNLRGKKKWKKRFPEHVAVVVDLCEKLQAVRAYEPMDVAAGG